MTQIGLITGIDPRRKDARSGGLIRSGVRRIDGVSRHRNRRIFRTMDLVLTGTQENVSFVTLALAAGYTNQDIVNVFIDTTVGGTVAGPTNFAARTGDFGAYNVRAILNIHVLSGRKILGKGGPGGSGAAGAALQMDMPITLWNYGLIASGGNGGSNGSGSGACLDWFAPSKQCTPSLTRFYNAGSGGGGAGYAPSSGATQSAPGPGSSGSCCNDDGDCGSAQHCGGNGSSGSALGSAPAIKTNGFTLTQIPDLGGTITGAVT
jgi:hypothetical protein